MPANRYGKRTAIEAPTRGYVLIMAAFGVLTGMASGILLISIDGWNALWCLPGAAGFTWACVLAFRDALVAIGRRRMARQRRGR